MSGISIGNRLTILPSTHGLSVGNGLYFSTGGGPVPPIFDYWINNRQREPLGTRFSYANCISFDADGNIIVLSSGSNISTFVSKLAYFSFDQNGNLNYGKFISSSDSIASVAVLDDGLSNKIAVGYDVTNTSAYIAKIDSSNQIVWQKTYFDAAFVVASTPRSAKIDAGGSIYVSGSGLSLMRFNEDGSQPWFFGLKIDAGTYGQYPIDFQNIQIKYKNVVGSNVYAIGSFNNYLNLCIVEINSFGTVQNSISILPPADTSTAFDSPISAVDSNGYIMFASNPYDTISQRYFGYVVNFNNSLQLNWVSKILGENSDQEVYPVINYGAMCFDVDGNWYITCQYYDYNTNALQTFLMKIDGSNNLNVLWQRKIIFGDDISNWSSQPRAIALDEDENIILSINAGYGPTSSYYDFILKLPSNGSKTGSYVVGGVDVSYSASSFQIESSTFSSEELVRVDSTVTIGQTTQSNTISSISSTDSVVSI
jgi:hypothetical protein